MIEFKDNVDNITPGMLKGFFAGWKNFPSPEKHLEILVTANIE